MRHLIAYDISDDSRRIRLARLLLDYGPRVQKSVFEAELSGTALKELIQTAAKYVDEEDGDSLRFYPLCANCSERVTVIGATSPPLEEDLILV